MLGEDVLQEVDPKAGEPIPVGNHNFCDSAAHDGVQKEE